MKLDLHVHTTYSDGDHIPLEVAQMALAAGLEGIAITDHDECRGCAEVSEVPGLAVFPGIELAATEQGSGVHVLGLRIDCKNEELLAYIKRAGGGRRKRARAVIARLAADGFFISMKDVENECSGETIGRPHIAAALVRKGYAVSMKDAFVRFLSSKTPYYVPLEKISVAYAASLIVQAGGLPVLAHPGLMKPGLFDELAPHLKGFGFWGVEAYHPAHTDGQCMEYESTARRFGLFVTAGSDFHGRQEQGTLLGQETRGGAYLAFSTEAFIKCTSV